MVNTDLVGRHFKSLTVLNKFQRVYVKHGTKIKWLCQCRCGNQMYLFRDAIIKRSVDYCPCCKPVAKRDTKLYHIYYGMLQRCYNNKNPSYAKYGGAGIYVCDEWREDYDSFAKWAYTHGYDESLTIDREKSFGPYAPWNCRWITLSENSSRANVGRQKNHSKLLNMRAEHVDGTVETITNIAKFCREHRLQYGTVMAYLHGRCSEGHRYNGWLFRSNLTKYKCNDYSRKGSTPEDESPVEVRGQQLLKR